MYRIKWTRKDKSKTGYWGWPMSRQDAREALKLLREQASKEHTYGIVKDEKSH